MKELSINNTELRNQAHEMCAEGSEDFKMNELQVIDFVVSKLNYYPSNIDIGFDESQFVYRWLCDISEL